MNFGNLYKEKISPKKIKREFFFDKNPKIFGSEKKIKERKKELFFSNKKNKKIQNSKKIEISKLKLNFEKNFKKNEKLKNNFFFRKAKSKSRLESIKEENTISEDYSIDFIKEKRNFSK